MCCSCFFFFFFKQKPAYEVRISDWSSDVCSSDLGLGILAALADSDRIIAEPGARFLDQPGLDAEVEDLADLRNALAVHDVDFDLLERRRDLVLDHLDPRRVAVDLVAVLDLAGAAAVEADRGLEFTRFSAGGRHGVAVHSATFNSGME